MNDETKTKEQLIEELEALRRQVAELKEAETKHKRAEEELRRRNEYLAALHETTLALMNRLELEDLLEAIVTRAGTLVGTQHGFIHLAEPGETEMIAKVGVGAWSKLIGHRVKFGEGVVGKVWKTGKPLVVENYNTWPDRLPDSCFDILRAVIGVPLKSGSEVVGVIGLVYLEEGRIFGEEEIELLSRFAELASIVLDNARLYTSAQQELAERRRTEEELREMSIALENAVEGISRLDAQGRYVTVNRAYASMLGYKPEEMIGMEWPLTVHPEDHEKAVAARQYMLTNGKAEFEARAVRKDGSIFFKQVVVVKAYDKQKKFMGSYCFMKDVTERKQGEEALRKAYDELEVRVEERTVELSKTNEMLKEQITERKRVEEKLRQQNEYLTALHETALGLMNRLELEDLLKAIVLRAGALVGTSHGYIYLVEPGETEMTVKVGVGTFSKFVVPRLKPGEGVSGKVWQTGQPLAVADYRTWPGRLSDPRLDLLRAVVGVPLKTGTQVVGAIGLVHLEEGRTFRDDEVMLLSRFAELASIALDNARLHTSAQQELTERKRAEEALATEKEQLAVTLRSIGDGVITTDMEGKIVLVNKAAEILTGWTQEEAVGKPFNEVFHIIDEKTRQPRENPVEKVLKTGGIVELTNRTTLIARNGTERTIADSGAPIRDKAGHIIGVVLVFRDVTEKQRIEEERLRASKLESVGILAGGIAHDFNNILTAILMNVSLAKMDANLKDEMFKRLTEAEKACLRAKDLTQQLLTFSKGGAPIKKTASIAELIKDSANFALRGSNVRCEFSIPEDLWSIEVDEGQMNQVINNLIINAQQAMPKGGTIRVQAENKMVGAQGEGGLPLPGGTYVKLSITDEGTGIPETDLPKIFDPYFTTKPKGSGLGLATSYSIIKRHDGHIGIESKLGVGTTFYIYLPASQKQSLIQKDPIGEDGGVQANIGRGKILVMDDEESIREVIGEVLSRLGYGTDFAKDGTEAIELYKRAKESKQPFAAIILDLTIPGGMGGKEAVQKLLEIDPQVKAIVSSGYSSDPVMADFRKYGFCGVVAKPYKIEELREMLHSVVMGTGG